MKRFENKVVFVTGAARGQGKNHAIRFAREGADIIAVDACDSIETVLYEGPTELDLADTAAQVEAAGGRIIARKVDVRDLAGLQATVAEGVDAFGRLDVIVGNAGIVGYGKLVEMSELEWQTMIDIDLTGVWKTIRAGVPAMIMAGNGGNVVLTSSTAGWKALNTLGHYVAAKHGVVGLSRNLANEVAEYGIRVNALAPTNVNTIMLNNSGVFRMFRPDLENPTLDDAMSGFKEHHLIKEPWLEVDDVSNAVLWMCSDEARYMTGTIFQIDMGVCAK